MLQNVQQQHQIVQSPARLGLSSPNSPSIQNSTPPRFSSQIQQSQQQQTAQQINTSTTITTSSALLPLLPPLPRAQSLLCQMATLSSRIFELSSNRAHWISAFRGSLPTFLSSQTQSFKQNPNEPSPSTTKEALSAFKSLQTQLTETISELQEILDLQDAKQKIAREIRSKDSTFRTFANKLREAEQVLDNLVDDYSDYVHPKRLKPNGDSTTTTISTQLNLHDILSYAHTISYTTFAPPEFGAGTAPLRGALPPAPQDEQLRASQLYAFADLDVGLPKTVPTNEKVVEPIVESKPSETGQLGNLAAVTGLIPPNIVVPSGWKPGMPVELPSDMPIVPPPGWKPGDPIPLPPLDGVNVSGKGRVEQQQVGRTQPQMFPKTTQESIHVRHVSLDIGDDDSSDYSSEADSSDDEE